MSEAPIKLGLFISGGGSTAKSIVEAALDKKGQLNGKVDPVCVIANKNCDGAKFFRDNAIHGKKIPVYVIPRDKAHQSKGTFGQLILDALQKHGANFVGQYGWLAHTPNNVIEKFKGKILNQHPGPLNKGKDDFGGKGMYGKFVHAARLIFAKLTSQKAAARKNEQWTEVLSHNVVEGNDGEYDQGGVVNKVRLQIPDHMLDFNVAEPGAKFKNNVDALAERTLRYEHQVQKDTLEDAAIAISKGKTLRDLSAPMPWAGDNDLAGAKREGPAAYKAAA